MKVLMLQGAGSNVGKSMLVAGLCRAAYRRGIAVAPFKPQNMANNAAATREGGEIGRAQALQARAAGREPSIDMNPVLLKPEGETGSQVIVRGRRLSSVRARDYAALKPQLLPAVLESFRALSASAELILVEGAGSPAEINLRDGDIANMGFAEAVGAPVVLIGDIERGGVIAQMIGTQAVLDPPDAARIQGFLINKFRGDPRLFDEGYAEIARRTGWRGYGVAPWFASAHRLPAEDSQDLAARRRSGDETAARVKIACPTPPRIANFDDLDPLAATPGVALELVPPGRALPGDADLVILPGSKSTRADLDALRAEGWDVDLLAHRRRGGAILGLCGGYQMLGRVVRDPEGIEGPPGETPGLGLLDVETAIGGGKRVAEVSGRDPVGGAPVRGYEIHMGVTDGPDRARPLLEIAGRPEGATAPDGRVAGAYVHGLFVEDAFRAAYLARLTGARAEAFDAGYAAGVEAALDALADHLEAHLDVDGLLALAAAPSL